MGFGGEVVADQIVGWISYVILLATLVIEGLAAVHCATRRADAFPVVGRLSKGTWMIITIGAFLFTLLTGASYVYGGSFLTTMVAFAGIVAALIYLLDVRPALRDVTEGRNNW